MLNIVFAAFGARFYDSVSLCVTYRAFSVHLRGKGLFILALRKMEMMCVDKK